MLKQYYRMLKEHDWNYDFSDDLKAYKKGATERNVLSKLAQLSPEHEALYLGFLLHYKAIVKGVTPPPVLPPEPQNE